MWTRILFLSLCGVWAGCASVLAPTQAMSDARQAIQVAREQKAEHYAQTNLAYAERYLLKAEESLSIGPHAYREAQHYAFNAKDEALAAREISQNIQKIKKLFAEQSKDQACSQQVSRFLWQQIQKQANLGDAQQVQILTDKLLKHLDENTQPSESH